MQCERCNVLVAASGSVADGPSFDDATKRCDGEKLLEKTGRGGEREGWIMGGKRARVPW